jgi:hypothetical protein
LIAVDNLYNVGIEIIQGITSDWNCTYRRGIRPSNYVGDIFGSLGGEPDFGFGSITQGRKLMPGSHNFDLAAAEMERRERFGLRALLK